MASSDEFKHESAQDCQSVVSYLQALIDGFQSGRLELGADGQSLLLMPRGLLDLEIRAKRKSGRSKVTLRIAWREREGDKSGEGAPLVIKG